MWGTSPMSVRRCVIVGRLDWHVASSAHFHPHRHSQPPELGDRRLQLQVLKSVSLARIWKPVRSRWTLHLGCTGSVADCRDVA